MLTAQRLFAAVFVGVGVAIIVRTTMLGGGQVGYLAGAVMVAVGILRWRATRA